MGRPRIHDEETRDALLDAALGLLSLHGAEAVSVRSVAQTAGTTGRAVYSLFGSQGALIDVLRARGYDQLLGYVMRVPLTDEPLEDLIQLGSSGFRTFVLDRPELYRLMTEMAPGASLPAATPRGADVRILRVIASRVRRVAEAGALPGNDPDTVAVQVLATCLGLALVERNGLIPPIAPGQVWEATLRALVRGFGTPQVVAPRGFAPQRPAR